MSLFRGKKWVRGYSDIYAKRISTMIHISVVIKNGHYGATAKGLCKKICGPDPWRCLHAVLMELQGLDIVDDRVMINTNSKRVLEGLTKLPLPDIHKQPDKANEYQWRAFVLLHGYPKWSIRQWPSSKMTRATTAALSKGEVYYTLNEKIELNFDLADIDELDVILPGVYAIDGAGWVGVESEMSKSWSDSGDLWEVNHAR